MLKKFGECAVTTQFPEYIEELLKKLKKMSYLFDSDVYSRKVKNLHTLAKKIIR